ncbi:MAG: hypothetical protein J5951_05895 [Bacteroidales bacterium]|nr:hypothetical protein [Bacteroidales bacterium]
MTLESETLDVGLVLLLSTAYVVTVWEENGKVFYRLTEKPEQKETDV